MENTSAFNTVVFVVQVLLQDILPDTVVEYNVLQYH